MNQPITRDELGCLLQDLSRLVKDEGNPVLALVLIIVALACLEETETSLLRTMANTTTVPEGLMRELRLVLNMNGHTDIHGDN